MIVCGGGGGGAHGHIIKRGGDSNINTDDFHEAHAGFINQYRENEAEAKVLRNGLVVEHLFLP